VFIDDFVCSGEPMGTHEHPHPQTWFDLPFPEDAEVSVFADQLLVQLRSDWKLPVTSTAGTSASTSVSASVGVGGLVTYTQGSLLAVGIQDFVQHSTHAVFTVLFAPNATVSLDSFTATRRYLILETLDTVKSRYKFWQYNDGVDASTSTSAKGWTYCGAEESTYSFLSAFF
jgi:prolyl oligopeptidase PreP (S9A serine peptidase family)